MVEGTAYLRRVRSVMAGADLTVGSLVRNGPGLGPEGAIRRRQDLICPVWLQFPFEMVPISKASAKADEKDLTMY